MSNILENNKSAFSNNNSLLISTAVPLQIENVDTDQIIPARFLKATNREGFGKNLFRDWRYDNDDENSINKNFVLNNPVFGGKILVAGKNFGCGSSREHAAWALKDAGFDIVISSFFADIFKNNALNNFLLPIVVSENFLQQIFKKITLNPSTQFAINMVEQQISILSNHNEVTTEASYFEISNYKKICLINGYDDIDYLINMLPEIEAFEQTLAIK